jgi:putative tryptophan/tyrosine transport system substrate-binding protein
VKRREFITLLSGAVALAPCRVRSQASTRRPLVAVLSGTSPTTASRYVIAFSQRLQDLGHLVGSNVDIVYRYAEGDVSRLPALVDQLVRVRPDIVAASSTQIAVTAKQATTAIPIVSPVLADPVGFSLVASHARPGGNVTGILSTLDTLPEKQLALAAEAVRGTVKVGMLLNPGFPGHSIMRQGAEAAAAVLGIKLLAVDVRSPDDLGAAFQSLARERVSRVFVLQDALFIDERRQLALLATAARLPTMFGFREHVEAGGLMSYGVDLLANFRRAAELVDKILKGAKPADLPVELPTKFELVINLKTAKALDLDLPPMLLARADEVIE